ncbi:MAG: long-chain fatty acid--CoA ligase [Oligoflexales bacterium]|nr:long-chain fatty acid--CoA ligase [Oligoflexales bacterium]
MSRYSNLISMQEDSCHKFAKLPLYGKKAGKTYEWTTYEEFARKVNAFRGGLSSLGVTIGDRVAIISPNCMEWSIAAYASYGLKAVFVPMYEKQNADECGFILNDCGASVLLVSSTKLLENITTIIEKLSSLKHIIAIDAGEDVKNSFRSLLKYGESAPKSSIPPDPDDVMGLVYTSGTTGIPKGVMLTHRNMTANTNEVSLLFSFKPSFRALSILPWAHVLGQMSEVHLLMQVGCSLAFNEGREKILTNLVEVSPDFIIAVPKLYAKIYDKAREKLTVMGRPALKLLEFMLQATISEYRGAKLTLIEKASIFLLKQTFFRILKKNLGGKLKYAVSGAAAIDPKIIHFLKAAGVSVYEGYGLSETAPTITLNSEREWRIGSVGKPIKNVTVKLNTAIDGISEGEGEAIIYGPNVMKGYFNCPDETRSVFTDDGGLRTGDIGRFDEDGYFYITSRVKEQFKLANGKFVVPIPIEEKLKGNPYIENVMVHGDNMIKCFCIISVNRERLEKWAERRNIRERDDALVAHPEVRNHYQKIIETCQQGFKKYEWIGHFILSHIPWTVENGILTQTHKLKREEVLKRYHNEIARIFKV